MSRRISTQKWTGGYCLAAHLISPSWLLVFKCLQAALVPGIVALFVHWNWTDVGYNKVFCFVCRTAVLHFSFSIVLLYWCKLEEACSCGLYDADLRRTSRRVWAHDWGGRMELPLVIKLFVSGFHLLELAWLPGPYAIFVAFLFPMTKQVCFWSPFGKFRN
jgi:hypothetical protein